MTRQESLATIFGNFQDYINADQDIREVSFRGLEYYHAIYHVFLKLHLISPRPCLGDFIPLSSILFYHFFCSQHYLSRPRAGLHVVVTL